MYNYRWRKTNHLQNILDSCFCLHFHSEKLGFYYHNHNHNRNRNRNHNHNHNHNRCTYLRFNLKLQFIVCDFGLPYKRKCIYFNRHNFCKCRFNRCPVMDFVHSFSFTGYSKHDALGCGCGCDNHRHVCFLPQKTYLPHQTASSF